MRNYSKDRYQVKNPEKYMGNKTPVYRSSWELSFMRMCDTNPAILKWASESVKIPYRNPFTNEQTVYVPDFLIVYIDANSKQHTELIEIKPAKQTFKEQVGKNQNDKLQFVLNQHKWAAATIWANSKGIKFRVITEGDMYSNTKKPRK